MRCSVKYKQIIAYVKQHDHYPVQTCVIAAVLKELGYEVRAAWNSGKSKNPKTPTDRDRKAIKAAIDNLSK